eukprot:gene7747-7201_t
MRLSVAVTAVAWAHPSPWVAPPAPAPLKISVDPANVTDRVGPHMYGSGIETYEHQMYGGVWSNMIYDDSVEDALPGPLSQAAGSGSWFANSSGCTVETGDAFNGDQAMRVGTGCTAVNMGLA